MKTLLGCLKTISLMILLIILSPLYLLRGLLGVCLPDLESTECKMYGVWFCISTLFREVTGMKR